MPSSDCSRHGLPRKVDEKMNAKILAWYANGETGISSKAMAAVFSGQIPDKNWARFGNHPSDPSDFLRCLKFLDAVPEAKEQLQKLKTLSPVWAKLVDNWDALEKVFIEEVGKNWCNGGSAKKTYDFMKSLGC